MRKRDRGEHDEESFRAFFAGYVAGSIPDYQAAAWLMAAFVNGLTTREKVLLTMLIADSGERLDLSSIDMPAVDKHSTGGVGDKPSLVLLPLLASMGVCVPMMSGRGLGHTGGTVDKLEAIPGMSPFLPAERYVEILRKHGGVFMAQTPDMAPLDRKLYALRDVTGTVESIALITASIIGKKATEDLDGLVLDVKCGNGAFMRDIDGARALARSLVDTAREAGIKSSALVTDMNEPLGAAVGHSVEVLEALDMLEGRPVERRFEAVTLALAAEMCTVAFGREDRYDDALRRKLASGDARETLSAILAAQGVKPGVLTNLRAHLPLARHHVPIAAHASGCIAMIDTYRIGRLMTTLRAGRMKLADAIDHSTGLSLVKHVGDTVTAGETIGELRAEGLVDVEAFQQCFTITQESPRPRPVIIERIA